MWNNIVEWNVSIPGKFGTTSPERYVVSFKDIGCKFRKYLVSLRPFFYFISYIMESFNELITKRRSTRKFTAKELTQDEVVILLKAALKAPASKRSNPWQFVLVDDKELLRQLAFCKEQSAQFIADAALAVVVMADPLASDVWIEDAAIAAIYLQLQAEDMGLGSCWVQVRERYTATGMASDEYVHGLLDIPLQLQVLCIIAIGHKEAERRPFDESNLQWEKIHLNKYSYPKETRHECGEGKQ